MVPFYRPTPGVTAASHVCAVVLGVYAENQNDSASEGGEEPAAALETAGVTHGIPVLPSTHNTLHNDTSGRWNGGQASAARDGTVSWFGEYSKAEGERQR